MVTSVVKREAVTYLKQDFDVSERRACHVLNVHWSLARYQSVIDGERLGRELDKLIDYRDKPNTIVSDNGTEMTSTIF